MTFTYDWTYNWQASLTILLLTVGLVTLGRFLLFKVPAFEQTRNHNRQENRLKIKTAKYPGRLSSSHKVAFFTYLAFVIAILPFIATFESQPLWKIIGSVIVILMVYDFFYYLMHRFLFHGQGYFRQVHAVHHQARKTNLTSIDALLLHPWEACLASDPFEDNRRPALSCVTHSQSGIRRISSRLIHRSLDSDRPDERSLQRCGQ